MIEALFIILIFSMGFLLPLGVAVLAYLVFNHMTNRDE